jgi:hypothetical protein
VGQFFAVREALGLRGDVPMGGAGGLQVPQQPLALSLTPHTVLVQELSGVLAPGFQRLPEG